MVVAHSTSRISRDAGQVKATRLDVLIFARCYVYRNSRHIRAIFLRLGGPVLPRRGEMATQSTQAYQRLQFSGTSPLRTAPAPYLESLREPRKGKSRGLRGKLTFSFSGMGSKRKSEKHGEEARSTVKRN